MSSIFTILKDSQKQMEQYMATKKYELTKEYFFHGEFWHQLDDNKGRFSARIEYSPYHGLILDYCISDNESPRTCEIWLC